MALEEVGAKLAAEGAAKYLATMQAAEEISARFVAALTPLVGQLNAVDARAAKAAGGVAAMGKDATAAAKGTDTLGDEAKGAADEAADLGRQARDGAEGLSVLDRAAKGAAERVGELATEGLAAAGEAVLQFAKDGIKAAGDFESGMNSFASVVGDSLDESGQSLDQFKDLFISLGRDLPVSTADVQQAAIELAKGGIEPATIAAGGLKQTLQFAAAAGLSLADAATISAKAVGGWTNVAATAQEKADFLTHSTDLLARAANASTVDVDELALGLYNSQGAAKAAGVTFDDTVTTLAAVASSFASSATAGTSFSNFIARIQPTTDPAAKAMARLNLLTAEGKSRFYDASGAFIGMEQAAGLLQNATKDLTDAEKSNLLQTIFGNDAKGVAIKLAELGAEGYDAMSASIAHQAGVQEQAALKQQGFNTAVDNMLGSLEAFQITAGSAVLPVLTKLVNLLASGINVVTDYVAATLEGKTALAAVAKFIESAAIPAIVGLTAATLVYGASALAPLLVNIPAMTAVLISNTGAFVANAVAVAAAAVPYALIAVAIGGVVYAYQQFNEKVQTATDELLNSRKWWTDSADAIADYGHQTGAAKEALGPLAASIQAMRDQIQGEVEDLAKRDAMGLVSDAQMQQELDTINQHRVGLQQATDAYHQQEQAIVKAQAATMTASAQMATATDATAALGNQASLTADDIAKLTKSLEDTYEKGQQAVQAYATTQSEFMAGIEDRAEKHKDAITKLEEEKQQATTAEAKAGIDDKIKAENAAYATSEQNAAQSYARQQAAQQAHLGQMLIDYTVAQAQLGNISKEKAAEITGALEKEYGLQESSVASTFLHMAGSIDDFSKDASGDVNDLIGDLRDQQKTAGDTQKAMDDYAKEYVATATSNFLDAKGDADQYADALEHIPHEVNTTVTTHYREEGREPGQGRDAASTPGRASGGPVDAMRPYLVGEQGPELFTPRTAGSILPAPQTRAALASPAQMAHNSSSWSRVVNISVDARGSTMTEADVTRAVQAGLQAEGDKAHTKIITGVP